MTLCDAGPLFALIDPSQAGPHARCRAVLPGLGSPSLTTWPCFTEARYLAHRRGGWPMQALLWKYVQEGALRLHRPDPGEVDRASRLMERYRDVPMDLADASLVAAAEVLGASLIFTLDRDFHVDRIGGTRAFEVVPG